MSGGPEGHQGRSVVKRRYKGRIKILIAYHFLGLHRGGAPSLQPLLTCIDDRWIKAIVFFSRAESPSIE